MVLNMRSVVFLAFVISCSPATGVTEKIDVPSVDDFPEEPSSQPSGEPSSQPSSEPSSQPSSEPSSSDPCDNPQTTEWDAFIPSTSGCAFGQNGNASDQQGKYRARTEQVETWTPPNGSQICDIRFDFETSMGQGISGIFGYDDEFLVALNDRVLLASQTDMLSELSPVSNSYEYSWNGIKNQQQSFAVGDYFHPGSASDFDAPDPPNVGSSYFVMGSFALDPHRNHAISENEIRFMLVTFGDNDFTDCFHSGFQSSIEIDYAP